jgi:hypothetical protein
MLHATLPRERCTQQNDPRTQQADATPMQHESLKSLALKVLARNKTMQQACNNEQKSVLHTGRPPLHAQQPAAKPEVVANPASARLETRVPAECPWCHGRLFWRSIYGSITCWRCHEPANEGLIADILWQGEVKWHQ